MAIQVSVTNNSFPFVMAGQGYSLDTETILTDGTRTTPLLQFTIMSRIAATGKWTPWISSNLGAADGTQYPMGILMNDGGFTAAVYAGGDILNAMILVGGDCEVDASQLVFDNAHATACTLTSIITSPANLAMTAREFLCMRHIFPATTVAIDQAEN